MLNLLSRHPDIVAGHLSQVAVTICGEASLALSCRRVGLWRLSGDEVIEMAFSGKRFEDLEPRRLGRTSAPAFFAALERRCLLHGRGIHELATLAPGSAVVAVQVEGHTWGCLTFEGSHQGEDGWIESELDFGIVLAELVGRCVERGRAEELRTNLGRAEEALSSFTRMSGDALCFEMVNSHFEFHGDPRSFLGPAPAGAHYGMVRLLSHVRSDERDLLERRYADWVKAGAPGVLTARLHFRIGPEAPDSREVELECRLMRTRSNKGARLWGT
ncbi:MAG: hypothetical protein P1V81_09070, partial [Planctomycetota bacterium]|nr:hypothetical protein [Planctomycetota bacterium]